MKILLPAAFTLSTLIACGTPAEGGQSGTVVPPHCVEVSRAEITDFDAIPVGFTSSLSDALSAIEGSWEGDLMNDGGSLGSIEMDLFPSSDTAWAIHYELEGDVPVPTGPQPGAVVADCGPTFAIDLSIDLDAGDLLMESAVVQAEFTESGVAELIGRIPLAEVQGDTTPDFDPADFGETNLQYSFMTGAAGTRLDLNWTGTTQGVDGGASGITSPIGQAEMTSGPTQP